MFARQQLEPAMKNALFLAMLAIFVLCAAQARAAEKVFVTIPFQVNAPKSFDYLGKAVPSTIQGRIAKPGALKGKTSGAKAASAEDARKVLRQTGADYAIWGVVNVMGNDCSVEVNSVDKNGKTWSRSASGPVGNLTGTVNGIAAQMAAEAMGEPVMNRPGMMAQNARRGGAGGKSDIIVNETGQNQAYLNPQFRYQGAGASDGSRMRSTRIKNNMVDMAVGDFNGDGKTEVAVLGDHDLAIYLWQQNGQLKELGRLEISRTNNNFSMRAMDLNRDGAQDLVVATFEPENNHPASYFVSFRGNKFSHLAKRSAYFASVMRTPPTFAPMLVGQSWDSIKLFAPGVYQMVKSGDKYGLGARLALPTGATVFNSAWIPGSGKNSDMLVMLTDDERVKVFQGNAEKPIHTTMERFSGSATGMEFYKGMPGLGVDRSRQLASKLFAPMRMIAADIGNTGENVLLLNKPISTAAQFFDRYRFFPQGEIHALYWDGVGLGLKWKTRRIRGSVAEIDLGDVNNDGVLDLVVGINTSPELGIGSRQCMITAYPLDTSQMDPNTPADMSDFETPGSNR